MSIYCPLSEALGIMPGEKSILDYQNETEYDYCIVSPFAGKAHTEESKRLIGKRTSFALKGKKYSPRTEEHRRNNGNSIAKTYIITFPNGDSKKVKNLTKFCKEHFLTRSCLQETDGGRRKQHKGYRMKRIDNE